MRLVDDNGESLAVQPCNTVHDVREFLNRGRNDLCVAVQGNCKVSGITFIVHHSDKPGFMLHTHNSFLQLTVNYDSVGDNHDIVKDDFIICIVQ